MLANFAEYLLISRNYDHFKITIADDFIKGYINFEAN